VYPLFEALDKVEKILEGKEFFVGNQLTEADIRLWVTIVRFPAAFPSALCFLFLLEGGYLRRSGLGSLRPGLREALQMQHSRYSKRIPEYQQVCVFQWFGCTAS
jgi:glutathione S-transferase